jgi:hypothetical protein
MKHFEYRIVGADQWRRVKHPEFYRDLGAINVPRPHIVPITYDGLIMALKIASYGELTEFCGQLGEILEDGLWHLAFRWKRLDPQDGVEIAEGLSLLVDTCNAANAVRKQCRAERDRLTDTRRNDAGDTN